MTFMRNGGAMTDEEYARVVARRAAFSDQSIGERVAGANRAAAVRLATLKATRVRQYPWGAPSARMSVETRYSDYVIVEMERLA
jgi:hypothetical protein